MIKVLCYGKRRLFHTFRQSRHDGKKHRSKIKDREPASRLFPFLPHQTLDIVEFHEELFTFLGDDCTYFHDIAFKTLTVYIPPLQTNTVIDIIFLNIWDLNYSEKCVKLFFSDAFSLLC